jgi:large subunit ribosomal protein L25
MQETAIINAEIREKVSSRENRRLRSRGYVPAVLYGKDMDPISITVKKSELRGSLIKYGRSAVYNLNLPGQESHSVVVKEIQGEPLTEDFVHADFQRVSLTEQIKIEVPIKIIGREAAEAQRLFVIQQIDTVTVRCLPTEVPKSIDIDVEKLSAGESVTLNDINLPESIELDGDPEQVVVTLTEAKEHVAEDDGEGNDDGAEDGTEADS